jgi:hypothetical protein
VSECAQTTDKTVDYHVYLSGRKVIKAFTANDFQFFDVNGQVIIELSDASIDVIDRVHITWRIQKNHQNNQKITLLCNKTSPTICPILAAQAAARDVRPNISKDEEQQYSAHLMRVWACVLLDEAGKSPDYIKKRL